MLTIEFKKDVNADDPFDDKSTNFQAASNDRTAHRGQVVSYASEVFLHQHRCHHFSLIVLGRCARIIRWDPIVTERFDYKDEPQKLGQFLWNFGHLTSAAQGHDPTADRVPENSDDWHNMQAAASTKLDINDHAREAFAESIVSGWPRWKLSVLDESTMSSFSSQKIFSKSLDTAECILPCLHWAAHRTDKKTFMAENTF